MGERQRERRRHRLGAVLWIRSGLAAALAFSLGSGSASTSDRERFLLRARPGTVVEDTIARHGLRLVREGTQVSRALYLVEDGSGGNRGKDLEDECGRDSAVDDFEPLQDAQLPEALDGADLSQSTAALLDALGNKSFVGFYGATVWTQYLNQPASGIVTLPGTRPYATGGGVVAIIDTGVDPNHPALWRALVPGYDFTRDLAGPASEWADVSQSTAALLDQSTAALLDQSTAALLDAVKVSNPSTAIVLDQSTAALLDTQGLPRAFGHGTMVAGIVHLVAPGARIMPLKAFSADGHSNSFDIIRAVYYAVDNGAKVINMSFSLTGASPELMRAVNYATEQGVICVASAGNNGAEAPLVYPAAIRSVMAVASTTNAGARSLFSNYGTALVHVSAPGESVITTYPGGHYAAAWGTSFSAPFVAGAAALIAQVDGSTNYHHAAADISHAVPLGQGLGFGGLDLYQAVVKRHFPTTNNGNGSPGAGK